MITRGSSGLSAADLGSLTLTNSELQQRSNPCLAAGKGMDQRIPPECGVKWAEDSTNREWPPTVAFRPQAGGGSDYIR
jgi:hypothetical protein